jgi:hypothetical protein
MISDPMKWMQTVMLPAFASKGITDKQAILNEIGAIFTNRTASQLYSTMYLQQANIAKNFKLNSGAAGIDELEANAKKTLTGKLIELDKKWLDLQLKLGDVILPLAIKAVDGLNGAIKNLTVWIDANPGKVRALTYAFMGLSAFLITGGLINMIIAAGRGFVLLGQALFFVATGGLAPLIPWLARMGTYLVMFAMNVGKAILFLGRALLLNPIGLVVTAIAAAAFLLWNNWSEISGALKLMWGDMKTGFVQLFHGDIGGAFKSFALVFMTGWQTIFNTLIAGANTILPASMQISKTTFADDYRNSGKPKEPWSPMVAPVPGKQSGGGEQNINLYLDGKKLTDVVIQRAAKEAMRPRTGTQGFDPTRSMLMPGTPSTALPRG